jgi:hypothetical protein
MLVPVGSLAVGLKSGSVSLPDMVGREGPEEGHGKTGDPFKRVRESNSQRWKKICRQSQEIGSYCTQ